MKRLINRVGKESFIIMNMSYIDIGNEDEGIMTESNGEMSTRRESLYLKIHYKTLIRIFNTLKRFETGVPNDESYKYQSPTEFVDNRCGLSYDYAQYQYQAFSKCDYNAINCFIVINEDRRNHAFTIVKTDNNRYIYVEAADKSFMGVYVFSHIKDLFDFVAANLCYNETEKSYRVYTYAGCDNYGCNIDELFDICTSGKLVYNNDITPINSESNIFKLEDTDEREVNPILYEDSNISVVNSDSLYLEDYSLLKTRKDEVIPFFIVLSFTYTTFGKLYRSAYHVDYTHAACAFNPDLEQLYSFNAGTDRGKGGISSESISAYIGVNAKSEIYVGMIMLTNKEFRKVRAFINDGLAHADETHYSFANIIKMAIGNNNTKEDKFNAVCSEFVNMCLRSAGINVTGQKGAGVTPDDLKYNDSKRVYKVFEGLAKDYRPSKTIRIIKNLIMKIKAGTQQLLKAESADEVDELDDIFTEAAIADGYKLKNLLGNTVDKALADPAKKRKFRQIEDAYINRNLDKLMTPGPQYLIIFGDNDQAEYLNLLGVDKDAVVKVMTEVTKSASASSDFKFLRGNPILPVLYFCIRYFTKTNDMGNVRSTLSIFSLAIYWSIFTKYYPNGVNANIMAYTIDNLTEKYTIKKEKNIFNALNTSIWQSYNFHKSRIADGGDKDVCAFIQRIRNDQNAMIRKITNHYMENWKEGNAVSTMNQDYDDSTPILDDLTNDTTQVQNVVAKVALPIIQNGIDIALAEAAAKMCTISVSDCREVLMKIITEDRLEEVEQFISALIYLYIYKYKHSPREIKSQSFLIWAAGIFKKTNSKDENVLEVGRILDHWCMDTGVFIRYKAVSTRTNYKKAILFYFVLSIQKFA